MSAITSPAATTAGPEYRNKVYRLQEAQRALVDDVMEGTDALVRAGERYTSKGPLESDATYQARLKRGRLRNLYRQTVEGLTGLITRRPITLAADTDPLIAQDAEDIDGQGNALVVFFAALVREAIHGGFGAVLVEYPEVPNASNLTIAEERRLRLRPYWVLLRAKEIINWLPVREGGKIVLGRVTLEQEVSAPGDGEFAEKTTTQWRVLRRVASEHGPVVAWEVYEKRTVQGKEVAALLRDGIYRGVREIPMAVLYAGHREDMFFARPACYDVAETTLDLWNVRCDHLAALYATGVPLPVITGVPTDQRDKIVAHGFDQGLFLPSGASFTYAEASGASLAASRQEVQDLLAQAATQGLSWLAPDASTAETATAKTIDEGHRQSRAATIAQRARDCVELAMVYHAQFRGLEPGSVTVPLDITHLTLDATRLAYLHNMVLAGNLSRRTLWDIMLQAGELPASFNPEDEVERLHDDGAARPPSAGDGDILGDEDAA